MTEPQEPSPINEGETPSPSPSPQEPAAPSGAAASSTASAKASPASPFVADPGAAFDPRNAPAAPELGPTPAEAEQLLAIEWEEEAVARWLMVQGELTHSVFGIADADWKHTQADLKSIAGPLARILNRYDTTRAVAAYNDPASVIFGMSMYTIRSMKERRVVLAQLHAEAEEEEAPPAAPPGDMPPPDPTAMDWTTG